MTEAAARIQPPAASNVPSAPSARPMMRLLGATALCIAAATIGSGPADADAAADVPPDGTGSFLAADGSQIGTINLDFFTVPGSPVTFTETTPDLRARLGSATAAPGLGAAVLIRAATWRCRPLTRSFSAAATSPSGGRATGRFEIRTPSCRDRFAVEAPTTVARGRRFKITVRDRWALGDKDAKLCVGVRKLRCVTLRKGASEHTRTVRAPRQAGRLRVRLRVAGFTAKADVAIGQRAQPARRAPLILTTGDSSTQTLDSFLADRLRARARVTGEYVVGSALSSNSNGDWNQISRRQARATRPDVTVVSIGGNEGFAMRTSRDTEVACCDQQWQNELARRQRPLMVTYAQQGRGRVIWLRLPVPRDPDRARITAVTNQAAQQAAAGLPEVTVLPIDAVLSPRDTFASEIRHGGRTVRPREPDGIHLSPAGTSILARLVETTLKVTGALRRKP